MSSKIISGKNIVIAIIASSFLIDFASIIFELSVFGLSRNKPITHAIRLILTGLMLYFMYNGKNWARWLTGILCAISGSLGLISGFYFFFLKSNLAGIVLLFMGVIYLSFVYFLFFSSRVKEFLSLQNSLSHPKMYINRSGQND